MDKKKQLLKYILWDLAASAIVWTLFSMLRMIKIDNILPANVLLVMPYCNFRLLIFIVPFFWIFVFYLSGYYNQTIRKSRLTELLSTLVCSFLGSLVLFFLLLIDDPVESYTHYYISFSGLFLLQFLFTYTGRICITQSATKKIHNRIWGLNTLIVGSGQNAQNIANELNKMKLSLGNKIIGFARINGEESIVNTNEVLGVIDELDKIIQEHQIQEIIVATENYNSSLVFNVLGKSYKYDIEVKIIPKLNDILIGGIRMSTIYATPLISISSNDMPYWQQNVKRMFDIFASVLVLLLLSPLFLLIAIAVKMSSAGPVFYIQERIGRYGKPFKMIKFRTMLPDSEQNGPSLTSVNDNRITKLGKTLRRYRIDELPQFLNVIAGNMSIIGYRPERKYFIDQIVDKAPHYYLLQKIRPGITSWGMVKYGYADSVDKMIERLEYDIIYIENISLMIDMKILIYTFKIIFSGRGV